MRERKSHRQVPEAAEERQLCILSTLAEGWSQTSSNVQLLGYKHMHTEHSGMRSCLYRPGCGAKE